MIPSLREVTMDPELTAGARNAVRVCLCVQPSEKVTLITDHATLPIAASLAAEIEEVGAPYCAWVLEEAAERPLREMPDAILEDLQSESARRRRPWNRLEVHVVE